MSGSGLAPGAIALVASIDTEEDNWRPTRDDIRIENIRALPALQAFLRGLGLRPTYFVDHPVASAPWSAAILREIAESGAAEIGAHLHPWNTPPLEEALLPRHSMLANLPARAAAPQAAARCAMRSTAATGRAPTSFRAGRFGLGPETVARPDRERLPGRQQRDALDRLAAVRRRSRLPRRAAGLLPPGRGLRSPHASADGPLLELPLSSGFTRGPFGWRASAYDALHGPALRRLPLARLASRSGILRRVILSPESESLDDMLRLARRLIDQGVRFLQLFWHSPSLVPGLSPFVRNAADRARLFASIAAFVDAVSRIVPVLLDDRPRGGRGARSTRLAGGSVSGGEKSNRVKSTAWADLPSDEIGSLIAGESPPRLAGSALREVEGRAPFFAKRMRNLSLTNWHVLLGHSIAGRRARRRNGLRIQRARPGRVLPQRHRRRLPARPHRLCLAARQAVAFAQLPRAARQRPRAAVRIGELLAGDHERRSRVGGALRRRTRPPRLAARVALRGARAARARRDARRGDRESLRARESARAAGYPHRSAPGAGPAALGGGSLLAHPQRRGLSHLPVRARGIPQAAACRRLRERRRPRSAGELQRLRLRGGSVGHGELPAAVRQRRGPSLLSAGGAGARVAGTPPAGVARAASATPISWSAGDTVSTALDPSHEVWKAAGQFGVEPGPIASPAAGARSGRWRSSPTMAASFAACSRSRVRTRASRSAARSCREPSAGAGRRPSGTWARRW